MELILDNTQYVFSPGIPNAGTITFSNLPFTLELENIKSIINVTDDRRSLVYDDEKLNYGGSLAANVLKLQSNTAGMLAADDLQINLILTSAQYEEILSDSNVNDVTFGVIQSVNITDASTTVLSSNTNRKGVIISNPKSGKDCWIAFGDNPVAEENLKLGKNETLVVDSLLMTTQEIKAICKTGNSTDLKIQEGV